MLNEIVKKMDYLIFLTFIYVYVSIYIVERLLIRNSCIIVSA